MWEDEASMRFVLNSPGLTPEEIAARIDASLQAIDARIGPLTWSFDDGGVWGGSMTDQADAVRARQIQATLDFPNNPPEYGVGLLAKLGTTHLSLSLLAGSPYVGRRSPASVVYADVSNRGRLVDPELVDSVFESLVQVWQPLMASVIAMDIHMVYRRGNWQIPVGYRLWLRDDTVTVGPVADIVTKRAFAGGTLLSIDPEWNGEQAANAIMDTLRMNNLDDMPHPVP